MAGRVTCTSLLAIFIICALTDTCRAQGEYPFTVPDSLGPFLRFGVVEPSTDSYSASVLVAVKGDYSCVDLKADNYKNNVGVTVKAAEDLYTYGDYTFVRFQLTISMGASEGSFDYMISSSCTDTTLDDKTSTKYTVTVPGKSQHWNWAYFSCNGFHDPALAPEGGINNLWNDLMDQHAKTKFHLLAGNGDQLYNDPFFTSNPEIKKVTLESTNSDQVTSFVVTPELKKVTDDWYFSSYAHHWMSDSDSYQKALASIPQTYSWDDHDSFNGYQSQIDVIRNSDIYKTFSDSSRRWYLLFQQHSTADKLMPDLAFNQDGPALSVVSRLGPSTAIVVPDLRSERTPRQVMSPASYDNLVYEMNALPDDIKHLVVLTPQPLSLALTNLLEDKVLNACNEKMATTSWADVADKIQEAEWRPVFEDIGKTFNFSYRNQFGVPDLTDLVDGWGAVNHIEEREKFIKIFQDWADARGARVTYLSGDAHIAFASTMFTAAKEGEAPLDPQNDKKWAMSATSSAIGNNPADILAFGVEGASLLYKEYIDKAQTTEMKASSVFKGTQGLPLPHVFASRTRNYLVVSQPSAGVEYLTLTWRCEVFDQNKELLTPVATTYEVVPYIPLIA